MKRVLKGSLVMLMMVVMISTQTALAASDHQELSGLSLPQEMTLDNAKKGIVRIEAGITDDNQKFKKKSTSSGFVASTAGGYVFVVTTWHSVNVGDNPVVQIIVKNDTAVDASIEAYSKEQDYCILRAGSAMNDKSAIPLRIKDYDQGTALSNGDKVISLGFSADAGAGTEFSAADVTEKSGEIKNISYSNGSATYIEHTAAVSDGLDGGVLVDEDGYVIGLNNAKVEADEGCYCALDIIEVDKLLDSNGIAHRTRDKDELYVALYNLCGEGLDNYKSIAKDDREDFAQAITGAIEVMSENPYDRAALQKCYDNLSGQLSGAERKTPKALILIIALGAAIAGLTARLIMLIVWNKKNGGDAAAPVKDKKSKADKKKKGGQDKADKSGEAVAGAAPAPEADKKAEALAAAKAASAASGHASRPPRREAAASSGAGYWHEAPPIQQQPQQGYQQPQYQAQPQQGYQQPQYQPQGYQAQPQGVAPSGYGMNQAAGRSGSRLIIRNTGREIPINKNIMTIGRSSEADISIPDDIYVARMHAMIENRMGMFFVRDLGTKNGVYLNGSRVGESGIRLAPGDVIRIGMQDIEFR